MSQKVIILIIAFIYISLWFPTRYCFWSPANMILYHEKKEIKKSNTGKMNM